MLQVNDHRSLVCFDLDRHAVLTCVYSQRCFAQKTYQFFALDRDHSTACTTCHMANDYKKYTCYGCHEHTPAKIKREHLEEGILEFEKCVACHRSAEEKDD